jgi:site-specific DNA-cytosine methylase
MNPSKEADTHNRKKHAEDAWGHVDNVLKLIKMKYGSLFGGIRTTCYAAKLLGWECLFNSEIEPFPLLIGGQHGYGGKELGDITHADFSPFAGMVDLLCGGFPCQDISPSGKGEGIDGARSGLWRHFHRAIEEIRPQYALIENSSFLPRRGLDKVLCDLASIGYDAEWCSFSAAEFGAGHIRNRTYLLAYAAGQRRKGVLHLLQRSLDKGFGAEINENVGTQGDRFTRFTDRNGQPAVFGKYDGLTRRLHVPKRLKACGNAQYWPIPYMIFKTLQEVNALTEEQWLQINYAALCQ